MKDVVGQLTIAGTVEEEIGGCGRPTAKGKSVKNVNQEAPLNERLGRCRHCAHSFFHLSIKKRRMFRKCLRCEEIIDVMTMQVLQPGIPGHKYDRKEVERRND